MCEITPELLHQTLSYGSLTHLKGWDPTATLAILANTTSFPPERSMVYMHNLYQTVVRGAKGLYDEVFSPKHIKPVNRERTILLLQVAILHCGTAANKSGSGSGSAVDAGLRLYKKHPLYKVALQDKNMNSLRSAIQNPFSGDSHMRVLLGMSEILHPTPFEVEALTVDNFDILNSIPSALLSLDQIVERIIFLQKEAPLYWGKVKELWYKPYIEKNNVNELNKLAFVINKTGLHPPLGFFEPLDISNITELAWSLSKLDKTVCAYLLGLPIHEGNFGPKILRKQLLHLSHLGPERYISEILAAYRSTPTEKNFLMLGLAYEKRENDEGGLDLIGEEYNTYSPFDRVYSVEGDHIYQYTRPEWTDLLEKEKNPYNRENIPEIIISQMKMRAQLAQKKKLCKSQPLIDLLKSFQLGELSFKTSEEKRLPYLSGLMHLNIGNYQRRRTAYDFSALFSRVGGRSLLNNVDSPTIMVEEDSPTIMEEVD